MRKILLVIAYGFLVMGLAGCVSAGHAKRPVAKIDINAAAAHLPSYSGPKASVTVSDFDVNTIKATFEIGLSLREMLVAAFVNSNRFSVVKRQELNTAAQEQGLTALASPQQQEAASPKKNKIKTADLIISAAVMEFSPQASGGRAGIGGGGGAASGALAGLLGAGLNKARITLNIRIVDASTSEVLAANKVQGQASDIAGGFFSSVGLSGGLASYANTPMEKAIRICIAEAVRYVSGAIPESYYKD